MRKLPAPVMTLFFLLGFQAEPSFAQNQRDEGTRKVATRVVPAYPLTARNMNLVGAVKLEALVLANGKVKSVHVKGGNPLLAQSAESAVREWKWEKSEHDTTELVEINFRP